MNTRIISLLRIFLIFIFFSSLFGCASNNALNKELAKLLGVTEVKLKKVYSIDEWGGFGEGYSLRVYELQKNAVKEFLGNPVRELPDSSNWKKYGWEVAPIDTSYKEVLNIGLNYYNGNKKLKGKLDVLKQTLEKDGVYYAVYYKPDRRNPLAALIFIFDSKDNKLYVIESSI